MTFLSRFGFIVLLALSTTAYIGCGSADDTGEDETASDTEDDGHNHGDTYDEIVADLAEVQATVKSASEADDLEQAHSALHQVGDLLGHVEEYAAKEDFTDMQMTEIKDAVEKLLDAYMEIDAKLHPNSGAPGQDYSEVEEHIDAGMDTLKKYAE